MTTPFQLPKELKTGVRFECQGSGKCCVSHGEYGHVFLTPKDRINLAKELKISTRKFNNEYCIKVDGFWAIKDNPKGGDCIFLENKKCSVYKGRPTQCRTWPFWPDVMNPKSWRKDVVSFCPGIGKGKLYSEEEILKRISEQQKSELDMVHEKLNLKK